MKNILESWLLQPSLNSRGNQEGINNLIYLAGIIQNHLDPLELEIASKICSSIYIDLYKNDFTVLKTLLTSKQVKINSYTCNIRKQSLWRAVWLNGLKNFQILSSKSVNREASEYSEILLWFVQFILENIDITDLNSLYLLRTLHLILNRTDIISSLISLQIINCMSRVAVSPLIGFRQLAENISTLAMRYVESTNLNIICDISLLPIRGIKTEDVVELFTDDFVKGNTKNIVEKVLLMFSTNIESKDGGFLYEKLLICTFEEWITDVWPYLFPKLQKIESEGEFFQSLRKYWIPLTVDAYKTDFYAFIKEEPIDLQLKLYITLESKKKCFLCEDEIYTFNQDTLDIVLKIVSAYRKKTIRPQSCDINLLISLLYNNLKLYLEDDETESIKKFFSHVVFYAHCSLKKNDEDFCFFEDFIQRIHKYCCESFKTDFFQVGAQILHLLLNALKGSHEDLKLNYKLEKRDYYENGENLLFIELKNRKLWKFDEEMFPVLYSCLLSTECWSLILADLLNKHYNNFKVMDVKTLTNVLNKVLNFPNLQNTEKIINCSNLLFGQIKSNEIVQFVENITNVLLQTLGTENINEKNLFRSVLYLEILTFAKRREFIINNIEEIAEKSLEVIDYILENDYIRSLDYRSTKVVETFITRIMFFITPNLNEIWPLIDKPFTISTVIKIIQKSNMKKPVSVSADMLRQIGYKMEENENDKLLKVDLLEKTLKAINEVPDTNVLKIRRSPESRLVIHAMCISQKDPNKPLLHWTMNHLLNIISNPETEDLSLASSLHTIELLISDNRLQYQTMQYIPVIIIKCIELFKCSNWVVRNADLQLSKSLIERIYGVSMNNDCRPKSIADMFILYPQLATYFFKILSAESLDERSVIALQFFSESQVKETVFSDNIQEILECFQVFLVHIIKSYQNHYGKLAVKAYVSLCLAKDIPNIFSDIESYILTNFTEIPKNILANLYLLMQDLYEKYKISYQHCSSTKGIASIHCSWNNIIQFLRQVDSDIYDFLLMKIKPIETILKEKKFENRLWIHNNLPFLMLNANSRVICEFIEDKQFHRLPEFFQIKMLSILLQRFEQNYCTNDDLGCITNSVLKRALSTNYSEHLSMSFFNFLLIFHKNIAVKFKHQVCLSKRTYNNMLNLLYAANTFSDLPNSYFESILQNFKRNISVNEEIHNDILSVLNISYSKFPKECRLEICKIVFYLSVLKSSYVESLNLICTIVNRKYFSILDALNDFLSINTLLEILGDKTTVHTFLNYISKFLDRKDQLTHDEEFYNVESEVLVPKDFVKTILKYNCFCYKPINKNV
ncbi:uncharacterized protein LOC126880016 [Diabrotica virgifera virgifera]|uniref:DUF2428 domain-containing protein n=1 Tax=Diabrotica virgifera virgifera TaxID=50390 RepID=A0ABM5JNH6_DIAVI|nr:uncharacterized protein LOC126880016 [Diabrotica virgifera virgifera]